MTIQEAIRATSSKQPNIKRRGWGVALYPCYCSGHCGELFLKGTTNRMSLKIEDILATDWEVKP